MRRGGFAAFAKDQFQSIVRAHASPVLFRLYDCSPVRMAFGRLQQELYPHARYPVLMDDRWESVCWERFLALNPGSTPSALRKGTVELLAQGLICSYIDANDLLSGFRLMCRPTILEAASASVLYSATEAAFPAFGSAGLIQLCEDVPFVLIPEQPDGAAANTRKRPTPNDGLRSTVFTSTDFVQHTRHIVAFSCGRRV